MPEDFDGVPLAEAVTALRQEVLDAMKAGEDGQDVAFRLGDIELEFQVRFTREKSRDAGIRWWVVSFSGRAGTSTARTHKVKLNLTPGRVGPDVPPRPGFGALPEGGSTQAIEAREGRQATLQLDAVRRSYSDIYLEADRNVRRNEAVAEELQQLVDELDGVTRMVNRQPPNRTRAALAELAATARHAADTSAAAAEMEQGIAQRAQEASGQLRPREREA